MTKPTFTEENGFYTFMCRKEDSVDLSRKIDVFTKAIAHFCGKRKFFDFINKEGELIIKFK